MLKNLRSPHSAIRRSIGHLKACLDFDDVYVPKEVPQVIFVCGANRKGPMGESFPSFRREEFIRFLRDGFSNVHPFLAESVFNKLLEKEKRKNILTLEQELFELSDNVAIVLESFSAFCELGAFSHNSELRKKILVINDSNHKNAPSFINLGPLKLIDSESKASPIFWYPMEAMDDGSDSISDTYHDVEKLLLSRNRKRITKVSFTAKRLSKNLMLFVRDLISLCGPVKGLEIVEIIKILFGPAEYRDLHTILALLEAMSLIRYEKGYYISVSPDLFFYYRYLNISKFKSAFRVVALREERL